MKTIYRFAALATLASVVTLAHDAAASVSNQEDYTVSNPIGRVHQFAGPNSTTFGVGGNPVMDGHIDSSGSWTHYTSGFPVSNTGWTVNGGTLYAQLQIIGSPTGSWLYDPAYNVDMSFTFRIEFTSTGISGTCRTPNFSATLSTTKTYAVNGSSIGGSPYNLSTGLFVMGASDFAIGAITAGCDNSANRTFLNQRFTGPAGTVGILMSPYADQTNNPGTLLAP